MITKFLRAAIPGLLFVAGCAASSGNMLEAELNANFELRHGQAARISGTELSVGFTKLVSDSRCGKGENCITAGDGVVRIWLQSGSGDRQEETLHTGRQGPHSVGYAGYEVHLVALRPERTAGVVVPEADYRVTLRVER